MRARWPPTCQLENISVQYALWWVSLWFCTPAKLMPNLQLTSQIVATLRKGRGFPDSNIKMAKSNFCKSNDPKMKFNISCRVSSSPPRLIPFHSSFPCRAGDPGTSACSCPSYFRCQIPRGQNGSCRIVVCFMSSYTFLQPVYACASLSLFVSYLFSFSRFFSIILHSSPPPSLTACNTRQPRRPSAPKCCSPCRSDR